MSNAYYIPRSCLSDHETRRHQQNLTMSPIDSFHRSCETSFDVFTMTPTHLIVPRFYGLENFGPPRTDRTAKGTSFHATFLGTLSEPQLDVVSAVKARLLVDEDASSVPFPRGGLLVLPCGFGKTVIALHVAAAVVKRKVLVLVHKQGLMEQWCDRARQFVSGATVGVLQQDRIDLDSDILVAMIQTVAKRDCAAQLKDRGLVIVDECHHLAARVYGSAMAKLSTAFVIGLSATPERKDGLTSLLFMTMGSIICRIEREREPAFVTSLVLEDKAMQKEVFGSNGRPAYSAMVNLLTDDSKRNAIIAAHIARLHGSGRNILVLSERVKQLRDINTILTKKEGVLAQDVGFYIGASTSAERERCVSCSVMLSTYQMAREGMDQKHLNALCLASPTSDLTQAVGRVQRDSGRERTGPPPLILDPCDTFSIFEHQAKRRRKFFKEAGFTIQRWKVTTGGLDTDGSDLFV